MEENQTLLDKCISSPAILFPPFDLMIAILIRYPRISLSLYFIPILLFGLATYIILLIGLFTNEQDEKKYIWDLVGIAAAGYTLVYWAKYHSGNLSIAVMIFVWILIAIKLWALSKSDKESQNKTSAFICIGFILCIISPLSAIYPLDKPTLVISSENKFIDLKPGQEFKEKVTIYSTLGNAHHIQLYANPKGQRSNLTVYVDGKEMGPFESAYIGRGNGESTNLRIETSSQIPAGTYTISLNSTYHDFFGKEYTNSNSFEVTVKDKHDSITQRVSKYIGSSIQLISKYISILIQWVSKHIVLVTVIVVVILLFIKRWLE